MFDQDELPSGRIEGVHSVRAIVPIRAKKNSVNLGGDALDNYEPGKYLKTVRPTSSKTICNVHLR